MCKARGYLQSIPLLVPPPPSQLPAMTAQEREDFLVSMATTGAEVGDPNVVIVQNQQVPNTQGTFFFQIMLMP